MELNNNYALLSPGMVIAVSRFPLASPPPFIIYHNLSCYLDTIFCVFRVFPYDFVIY